MRRFASLTPLLIALIFAVVAASRISRLGELELDDDEVWSICMSLGTPGEIIARTPYDWPPGFYLALGAWRGLVGIHPAAVSLGTTFAYLLGLACFYRALRRLFGAAAALIGMIALSALGQTIMMSMMIRGYGFLLALSLLMFWLTPRYFDHPTLRRAVPLGVVMAAMFYIHMTAVIAYVMLGLFTLFRYRRGVWRWWLPGGLAAALAAPEIVNKVALVGDRASQINPLFEKPALELLGSVYGEFVGYLVPLWLILFAASAVAFLIRTLRRPRSLSLSGGENTGNKANFLWLPLLLIWILFPTVILILNRQLGFMYSARHMNWALVGMAVLVGVGLAGLPRPAALVGVAGMVVAMFWAIPPRPSIPAIAFTTSLPWLAERMKPGDVVLIDPNAYSSTPYQWDLFARLYFPQGLQFVKDPTDHPRVWYVSMDGRQDQKTYEAVKRGRIAGPFVGKWDYLIRLWEGPPDAQGIPFANGMRYLGSELPDAISPSQAVLHEDEDLHIRLWWAADRQIELDYSTALLVINDATGQVLAQLDGPPEVGDAPQETSRWQTGRYYVDERLIDMPMKAGGMYTVYLAVYQWWDNLRINAPGLNSDRLLPIQRFMVKSW